MESSAIETEANSMAGNSFSLISQLRVIAKECQAVLDACIVQDYCSRKKIGKLSPVMPELMQAIIV